MAWGSGRRPLSRRKLRSVRAVSCALDYASGLGPSALGFCYVARMSLPRRIAWRYLRRPTDALVSAVGAVSVFGLVIGVMALVISMALMTGYRRDLQRKLLGGNAEVFVYPVGGSITNSEKLLSIVRATPGVAEASPVIFQQAVVTTERNTTGSEVMIKGIDP